MTSHNLAPIWLPQFVQGNSNTLNYTTVDPKQFVFFNIETRACDVQSWETKDCKAEAATAAQSWETNIKDCKAETDTAVQRMDTS